MKTKILLLSLLVFANTNLCLAEGLDIYIDGIYYRYFSNLGCYDAYVINGWGSYEYGNYSGAVSIPKTAYDRDNRCYNIGGINPYGFANCPDLISVTLPNNSEYFHIIRKYAFQNCVNLQSVNIPSQIVEIDEGSFYDCRSLASIKLPSYLKYIANYAFYGCTSLSNISLPNSITRMGKDAFRNCTSITQPLCNIHVFAYLPPSYSGEYSISSGIESIAGGAFRSCSKLTSVIIPSSVIDIGDGAFSDCKGLKYVICEATIPPQLGTSELVFRNVNCSKTLLYVPDESVEAYKAADQWKEFKITPRSQSMDNIYLENNASQKILRDGHIYIQRENKVYTITGTEL